MDTGFTLPLLRQGRRVLASGDLAAPAQFQKDVQKLLCDIATFCPLATDSVENLHGQNQYNQLTWRGTPKTSASAAEVSVLSSLTIEHAYLKSVVMAETMPTKMVMSQMTKHIGRKTKKPGIDQSPKKRLAAASFRRTRRLSPWNVFLKKKLSARGHLSKEEYKEAAHQIATEWKLLADKEEYIVEAEYQQSCRDELATRPLTAAASSKCVPSGSEQTSDIAASEQSTSKLEAIAGLHRAQPKLGFQAWNS